jgi:adenylate cyclase
MVDGPAWLEDADGRRHPIAGTCALGRAAANDIVIDDGKVSRRHALIHKQDDAEYWVIDLGSGNGTYLNGRRITLATRLSGGDTLSVGEVRFTFGQATGSAPRPPRPPVAPGTQTIIDVRTMPCWLLVADIKGSTALSARLSTTDMAMLVGRWMAACREVIEQHGGIINKYLGDGFLAYWHSDRDRMPDMVATLDALRDMRVQRVGPPFRIALHYGLVTFGGGGSAGEDSLSGRDVALAFRMESLAGSLGCDAILSEAARAHLPPAMRMTDVGTHTLQGFEDDRLRFFVLA